MGPRTIRGDLAWIEKARAPDVRFLLLAHSIVILCRCSPERRSEVAEDDARCVYCDSPAGSHSRWIPGWINDVAGQVTI